MVRIMELHGVLPLAIVQTQLVMAKKASSLELQVAEPEA